VSEESSEEIMGDMRLMAADPTAPMHFALCADRHSDGSWSFSIMVIDPTHAGRAEAELGGVLPQRDTVVSPRRALIQAFCTMLASDAGDDVL
jgi:hypothetical protein